MQQPEDFARTSVIFRRSQLERLRELAGDDERSVSAILRKILDRPRALNSTQRR